MELAGEFCADSADVNQRRSKRLDESPSLTSRACLSQSLLPDRQRLSADRYSPCLPECPQKHPGNNASLAASGRCSRKQSGKRCRELHDSPVDVKRPERKVQWTDLLNAEFPRAHATGVVNTLIQDVSQRRRVSVPPENIADVRSSMNHFNRARKSLATSSASQRPQTGNPYSFGNAEQESPFPRRIPPASA